MSTRAGIKVKKSGEDDLYFYQHYDGYPTGVLPDLIKMEDKDDYNKFIKNMRNHFEEIYDYPCDIDFSYVIDFDQDKIFTYTDDEVHLLRIDLLDTDVIEIE